MYASLVQFDGPRSPELVAAEEFAGRQRILPAIAADPELQDQVVAMYALRGGDGRQVIVTVTRTESALERIREVVGGTELLPDEDPALLTGPDRVEIFRVPIATQGTAFLAEVPA